MVNKYHNPYPENTMCKRPKDSSMRQWCRCMECLTYEREQSSNSSEEVGETCTDNPSPFNRDWD